MMSKKTKYAFKALFKLAKHYGEGTLLIVDIAESEHIPRKFLEIILLELKKNGYVRSKMGKGGGYYLAKSPETIRLAEIYRIIEGPIALMPCVSLNFYERCDDCPDEQKCHLHSVMIEIRDCMLRILEGNTLDDILKRPDSFKLGGDFQI